MWLNNWNIWKKLARNWNHYKKSQLESNTHWRYCGIKEKKSNDCWWGRGR